MRQRNLVGFALGVSVALAACTSTVVTQNGDDDGGNGGTGGMASTSGVTGAGGMTSVTSATNTTSTSSSSTAGAGGGMGNPCQAACEAFYACTQLQYNGMKICPGIPASAEQDLVAGCLANNACSAIGGLVGDGTDPAMCQSGIDTVKGLSAEFAAACDGM